MDREVSHYVVTAHPPGGVLHTVKCNFMSPDREVSVLLLSLHILQMQVFWIILLMIIIIPHRLSTCQLSTLYPTETRRRGWKIKTIRSSSIEN